VRPLRYSIDVSLDGCSREPLEEKSLTESTAELSEQNHRLEKFRDELEATVSDRTQVVRRERVA
jgi:hypothetical protein